MAAHIHGWCVFSLLALAFASCSSSKTDPAEPVCIEHNTEVGRSTFCSVTCNGSCAGGETCAQGKDRFVCVPGCVDYSSISYPGAYEAIIPGAYECKDGVTTLCEALDETHCEACGCPSTLRCEKGVGCVPLNNVGGKCETNRDCNTNNCSPYAKICRVAVGQPCTLDDCDLCNTGTPSYCGQSCSEDDDCQIGHCFSSRCYPSCGSNDTCASGQCVTGQIYYAVGPYDVRYCSMPYTVAPRDLGQPCTANTDCKSGDCFDGHCSKTCATTAECGPGYICSSLPCTNCGGVRCRPICDPDAGVSLSGVLPPCSVAACGTLVSVEGTSAMACDPRSPLKGACKMNEDCREGVCGPGGCMPAGGFPNGEHCTAAGDCQSKTCTSNSCRGAGLVGDACTISDDCLIGWCCQSGPSAGKCAPSC
jgi:hypothetical protein